MSKEKSILFVRSGGGMPGVDIHVGIWRALQSRGIVSTACAGTSAGALVSSLDAYGLDANQAWHIVSGLNDRDVYRKRFAYKLRKRASIMDARPAITTIARSLSGREQQKPLQVSVLNEATGESIDVTRPKIADIYASMAIQGVFLPCKGRSDGGPVDYLPLPCEEICAAYNETWLLLAAPSWHYKAERESVVSRFLMAMSAMIQDQVGRTLERAVALQAKGYVIRIIRPEVGAGSSCLHFDHDLIDQAYESTQRQINEQLNGPKNDKKAED